MVKMGTFLGVSFASLGVVFFVMTVNFIFTSVIHSGASTITYPYRPLALPSLVTGLVFFDFGIFGIWIEYLRGKRRKEAMLKFKLRQSNKEKKN
jgi:hypothetical protein